MSNLGLELRCGIFSVKMIADSISRVGVRIRTFELEYPRYVHAELMTHRLFSRNAASSRAIPVAKMIEHVKNNPVTPLVWGKNKAGMQSEGELEGANLEIAKNAWNHAAKVVSEMAEVLNDVGLHKQFANRILEPFQTIKTIVTATEFDNWFWLRNHKDAQPEIHLLASMMLQMSKLSEPELLKAGEWHTPYVLHERENGELRYYVPDNRTVKNYLTVEDARKISASCCGQVSYRKLDDSLEKAINIYDRLVESKPVHASPFEHIATPMKDFTSGVGIVNLTAMVHTWEDGVTHTDRDYNLWSGNFRQWIQFRQLIPDNVCNNYVEEVKE